MENQVIHIKDSIYEVFAASKIGKNKIENQDYYMIYSDSNKIILVLADGLGSAVYSREGAKKICEIGIELLKDEVINESFCYDLLNSWKDAIKHNHNLYDTTFKYIVIDNNYVHIGGVGDGWLILKNENEIISKEISHSFSNQTDSIMSTGLSKLFFNENYSIMDDFICLMSTDGFSEDIDKSDKKKFLGDLSNLITTNKQRFMEDFEDTLDNWPNDSNCDDKSVIVIKKVK